MLDCNVTGDSIIRTSHLGNSAARTLIVQLNSAARHVARKYGIPVVDVEAMGLSFANPTSFFRDGHHPSPHVTKEILNIYINIWVQHHAHRHSAIHNPGHSGQLKDLTWKCWVKLSQLSLVLCWLNLTQHSQIKPDTADFWARDVLKGLIRDWANPILKQYNWVGSLELPWCPTSVHDKHY